MQTSKQFVDTFTSMFVAEHGSVPSEVIKFLTAYLYKAYEREGFISLKEMEIIVFGTDLENEEVEPDSDVSGMLAQKWPLLDLLAGLGVFHDEQEVKDRFGELWMKNTVH